jgi:enterochelin esterase family protein
MVHVLISPGSGGEAQGTRMRSIQYDTVSGRYGQYLLEEVLPDVEKTYKLRRDGYSRAIAGASSGAICAFNAAWNYTDQFSRVLSHIVALQRRPEQRLDGVISFPTKCGARRKRIFVCGFRTGSMTRKSIPEAGR